MHATASGTAAFAARFPALSAAAAYRKLRYPAAAAPPWLTTLGMGTYLGAADDATDAAYAAAARAALAAGIQLFDTAINYRHQRSERVLGGVFAASATPREEIFVCSKAGFVPCDGAPPADPAGWMRDTWLRPGLIPPGQLAAGCHCMAPVFLIDQLQRSLDNLQLDCLDVFYLHNPETQQAELSREEFYRRLRAAFEVLEKAAAAGRIQWYGAATWSGFRVPPDSVEYLDLQRMVSIAREVAGDSHRFRFIQLPYNLAMPEAYVLMNQVVDKPPYVSVLNAAYRLGVNVIASASLGSGRLSRLPPEGREYIQGFLPPAGSDAELALHFVRATAMVQAGLAGMASAAHVAENARALAQPPAPPAQVGKLLQQ